MAIYKNTPPIVTNGLVLALDAANPKSYVSGSTNWFSLGNPTLSGSLTNGPTFNSGNRGSIVFDGVNDYVSLTSDLVLDTTKPFTITLFFNLNSYNNIYPTLFTIKTSIGNSLVLLLTLDEAYTPLTFGWNGSNTYRPSSILSLNKWYNISLVYNGSGITSSTNFNLYINSILQTLSTSASFTGIGQVNTLSTLNTGVSSFYFNGNISQTFIYNRALSTTEVLQNYNATKGRFGL
jgi:hypothetical protein